MFANESKKKMKPPPKPPQPLPPPSNPWWWERSSSLPFSPPPFCCLQDLPAPYCLCTVYSSEWDHWSSWERVLRVPPFGSWESDSPSLTARWEASLLDSLLAVQGYLRLRLLCPLVGLYVAFTFLNKVIDMKEFCGWRQQPQRTPSLKSAKGKHTEPSKECGNKNWKLSPSFPSPPSIFLG